MLEDPPTRAYALRRVFGGFYLSRPSCARLFCSRKRFSAPHRSMGLAVDVILWEMFGFDKILLSTSNDRPMKHFLVTHWPVFLYLFKYFIGRSFYVESKILSKPNAFRNITSVGQPIEWCAMRHHSAKGSNREQETKDRLNVEKTRRSARQRTSRRVFKYHFMGSRIFAFQRKCPSSLVESRDPFRKRGPGLLSFGTFLCRSKGKYT